MNVHTRTERNTFNTIDCGLQQQYEIWVGLASRFSFVPLCSLLAAVEDSALHPSVR